jgi:Alpha-galactosidases/6-phospho-beta-glucosidases, family 4 of glycosyl hydrolases
MDWFLQYKVDGKDAYPKLFEISTTEEQILELSKIEPDYSKMGVTLVDLVRFNVMKHFGYFVSESPFHMSEYVPYYRKNNESIEKLRVNHRWWLDHEMQADEYFDELKSMLKKGETIPVSKTFEYAPEIIHANLTGRPFRANLNVANTGLIENLPSDCVVEVPCYADAEGIHPCYVGKLPDALAALNVSNINVHVLMAKAMEEKKFRYIYEAVALDPLAAALLDLNRIHKMVDELIAANKEYLEDFR